MNEQFLAILKRCKAGVYLTINQHRDYYQDVQTFLSEEEVDIEQDILKKMIETDTVVRFQFYPDTPIGSYTLWHFEVEQCIANAWETLQEDDKRNVLTAGQF